MSRNKNVTLCSTRPGNNRGICILWGNENVCINTSVRDSNDTNNANADVANENRLDRSD